MGGGIGLHATSHMRRSEINSVKLILSYLYEVAAAWTQVTWLAPSSTKCLYQTEPICRLQPYSFYDVPLVPALSFSLYTTQLLLSLYSSILSAQWWADAVTWAWQGLSHSTSTRECHVPMDIPKVFQTREMEMPCHVHFPSLKYFRYV